MKKAYSNWYAGLIHFSLAGVAVPILLSIALSVPLFILFLSDPEGYFLNFSLTSPWFIYGYSLISSFIIYFLGAWYSASYFKRKIEILDTKQVLIFATIFVGLLFLATSYFDYYNMSMEGTINMEYYIAALIELVIDVVLFYTLSYYHFKKNGLIPNNPRTLAT